MKKLLFILTLLPFIGFSQTNKVVSTSGGGAFKMVRLGVSGIQWSDTLTKIATQYDLEGLGGGGEQMYADTTRNVGYDATYYYVDSLVSTVSGGDVSKVGTPVDNQVGVWTGNGTIEGDADLTFDGDTLDTKTLRIANSLKLPVDGVTGAGIGIITTGTDTLLHFGGSGSVRNTFFGVETGNQHISGGGEHTAFGYGNMPNYVGGIGDWGSSMFGTYNGYYLENGDDNLFLGAFIGYDASFTNGSYNIGVGTDIFRGTVTGTPTHNIGMGYGVLRKLSGSYNIGIGFQALQDLTATHSENIAIGYNSGTTLNGQKNILIGSYSGEALAGDTNIAIGYYAAGEGAGTNKSNNISIGLFANSKQTNGRGIIAIGSFAAYGTFNTRSMGIYIGDSSAFNITTGYKNTFIGRRTGRTITTGYGNVFIGNETGDGVTNTTANRLMIDNSNTSTPLIHGDFNADTLRVNGTLSIRDVSATNAPYILVYNPATDRITMKDTTGAWTQGIGELKWSDTLTKIATQYDIKDFIDNELDPVWLSDSVDFLSKFDTTSQIATRYWVDGLGYLDAEVDPEWVSDSVDYLHKSDTTTKVATRYWVDGLGYLDAEVDPIYAADSNQLLRLWEYWNNVQSASRLWGGTITNKGDGTVDVAAGGGIKKIDNADPDDIPTAINQGQGDTLVYISWNATNVALTDNAYNYIYLDGSDNTIKATTNFYSISFTQDFTVGRVYKYDGGLTIRLCGTNAWNFNRRVQLFGEEIFPIMHKGMNVSETGQRYLSVTEGVLWAELVNRFPTVSKNTSTGDKFTAWYRNGVGGWTYVTNQSQINNTSYDDNDGTLGTLSANRYGVHWIYMAHNDSLHSVYGWGDYTLTQAEDAAPPSSLPGLLSAYSTFIAKIIVQKSATNFYQIYDPDDTEFSASPITDHGSLSGLTDDDHTLYQLDSDTSTLDATRYWVEQQSFLDWSDTTNNIATDYDIDTLKQWVIDEDYLKWADTTGNLATDYNLTLKQNVSDTSTLDATRYWVGEQGYLTSFNELDPVWTSDSVDYLSKWDTNNIVASRYWVGQQGYTINGLEWSDTTVVGGVGVATAYDINEFMNDLEWSDTTGNLATDYNIATHTHSTYQLVTDTSTLDATRYWVGQQGYVDTEVDPVWTSDSVDYLSKWDTNNIVASRYWVGQQGYITSGLEWGDTATIPGLATQYDLTLIGGGDLSWSDTTAVGNVGIATYFDILKKQDDSDTTRNVGFDATYFYVDSLAATLGGGGLNWSDTTLVGGQGLATAYDLTLKQNVSDTSTLDATRYWVGQQGYATDALQWSDTTVVGGVGVATAYDLTAKQNVSDTSTLDATRYWVGQQGYGTGDLEWSDTTQVGGVGLGTAYDLTLKQNVSDTTTKDATRYWVELQGYGNVNLSDTNTPVNNQIAIWNSADSIIGSPNLTYQNAVALKLEESGGGNALFQIRNTSAQAPYTASIEFYGGATTSTISWDNGSTLAVHGVEITSSAVNLSTNSKNLIVGNGSTTAEAIEAGGAIKIGASSQTVKEGGTLQYTSNVLQYYNGSGWLTPLTSEVDGSISNEGSLGVGAGGADDATVTSNTSGSSTVTFTAGTNIDVTENTSTPSITIATESDVVDYTGTQASGNVSYFTEDGNTMSGEAALTYNATSNTLTVDTVYSSIKLNRATTSYSGTVRLYTTGAAGVTAYNLVYLSGDNTVLPVDRDAVGTAKTLGMALETKTSGQQVRVITDGIVYNSAWNWTAGGYLYNSSTAGEITTTVPATAGYGQRVAIAVDADRIEIQIGSLVGF